MYSVVLISAVQQVDSVIHIHVYSFSYSFTLWFIIEYHPPLLWDSNLFLFFVIHPQLTSLCNCFLNVWLFFPPHKIPNYCGKTVYFTKKKKKRHSFPVYLPRVLCWHLLSPVLVPQRMDYSQQRMTNNLRILEPFEWGHFRNLPEACSWPGSFSRMMY